jgi:putative peptidoglycan lipid II flippase
LQVSVKALDALFPLLVAAWFGRSELTDVYYFAWAVFALAGSLVFSAFHDSAVVPVLAELKASRPGMLPVVRGSLFAHAAGIGCALSVGFGVLAAGWFAVRYEGRARHLALCAIAPFSVYLMALAIKTFLGSVLNAEHRFAPQPIAGAVGAAVTLTVMATTKGALSIVAIPAGSAAGEAVAVAVLAATVRAAKIAIHPTFARPEPVVRIARLVAAEVGGNAATRANPVVDQLMASLTAVAGGGTLLKLTGDVASVPTSLLQASLLPVLLTHLSDHAAAGDLDRVRSTVRRTLGVVVAVLSLCAVLLWTVREPLLGALFATGAMDARGVERMAHLLPYHLVGLAPFGALLVLARAHVALQNSRIMLSMGLINAALNASLDASLVSGLGLEGLALATSITYAAVATVFAVRLRAHLSTLDAGPLPSPAGP